MDLTFNENETAFRDELRGWLAENAPGDPPERGSDDDRYAFVRDWQRKLAADGWASVHWPWRVGRKTS